MSECLKWIRLFNFYKCNNSYWIFHSKSKNWRTHWVNASQNIFALYSNAKQKPQELSKLQNLSLLFKNTMNMRCYTVDLLISHLFHDTCYFVTYIIICNMNIIFVLWIFTIFKSFIWVLLDNYNNNLTYSMDNL